MNEIRRRARFVFRSKTSVNDAVVMDLVDLVLLKESGVMLGLTDLPGVLREWFVLVNAEFKKVQNKELERETKRMRNKIR